MILAKAVAKAVVGHSVLSLEMSFSTVGLVGECDATP